jgi:hypothetical protein
MVVALAIVAPMVGVRAPSLLHASVGGSLILSDAELSNNLFVCLVIVSFCLVVCCLRNALFAATDRTLFVGWSRPYPLGAKLDGSAGWQWSTVLRIALPSIIVSNS